MSVKRLARKFRNWKRSLLVAAMAAALVMVTGCGDTAKKPEDGAQEPEQGYYIIKVTPKNSQVTITPGVLSQTLPFTILGFCHGKNLPPGCDTMEPHWRASPDIGMQITIADPLKPETTANVRLDFTAYQYLQESDIIGTKFPTGARFYPSRLPDGMKPKDGRLTIEVQFPSPTTERTEEPATRQRLNVWPELARLFKDTAQVLRAVELFYNGPPNQLLPPIITGDNASDWVVNVPDSQLSGDGLGPIVTVRYIGAANAVSFAAVTFRTPDVGNAKGRSETVPLHRY